MKALIKIGRVFAGVITVFMLIVAHQALPRAAVLQVAAQKAAAETLAAAEPQEVFRR